MLRMKALSKISIAGLVFLCIALFLLSPVVARAQVVFPARGGTGTSTVPTYGQVLVGNSAGTYTPTATTSLGITADVAVSYPLQTSGGVVSLLFGTTTANSWSLQNTFASLFATNASSTSATSTNLAVTGAFNFLGTVITNVSTWFNGLFDSRLATKTTTDLTEGANLYFTNDRVASVIAGTTTTALAEGSNLYFTNARADARINATTTLGTLLAAPNLATVGTITTGVWQGTAIGDAYLTKSGDWTGTFDGQEGTYYLSRANHSGSQLASTISDFTQTVAGIIAGTTTDAVDEGSSNLYFTNARARSAISLTTTGTTGAATYDSGTGVLNVPQYAGTTYTATYPVTLSGSAFGLDFGTTSSNTWAGTQTFTNNPVLGTLTGFIKGASGALSAVTSIVPADFSLTKGNFLVGDDAGVAQATSTIFINSIGQIGIGTTSPTHPLTIRGTLWADNYEGSQFSVVGTPIVNTASAPPTAGTDNFIAGMVGTTTAGLRSGAFTTIYNGGASSGVYQGLLAQVALGSSATGNLTITTNGGGLRNRYVATNLSTGYNVAQMSAVGALIQTSGTYASTTDAAAFHADSPSIAATSLITNMYGLWVRGGSVTGTLTNRYGVYIDSLVGGTNRYGIYQAGSSDPNYFAGNIGIGSTSALYDLSIAGGANNATKDIKAFFGRGDSAVGTIIGTGDGTTNSGFIGTLQNYPFYFVVNNTEVARFDTSGQLGIGTTSPYARLSVVGQAVAAYFTATTTTASTFPYASTTALTVAGTNGLTVGSLTGLLKATTGAVSAATAGTDYENPLTFTYPITRSANAISLAFGTTTSNTWAGTQTFGNTSATNATTTGAVNLSSFTSALLQVDGDGDVAEYAGTSCTNQFVRSLSALGVATCATVANSDLANSTISGISLGSNLADLTATNSTLTFSGTYNGGTARSIGLNLGNANTWTALQTFAGNGTTTFAGGIQGGTLVAGPYFHATSSTATSTFSGGLRGTAAYFSGLIESVGGVLGTGNWNLAGATVKQKTYPGFSWPSGSATTTTATTTVPMGQAMNPQLFNRASCRATSGTSGYRIGDGTNWSNYIVATSTAGNYAFTSNNSFVLDENRVMEVGPLTNAQITCGFDITVNN